MPSVKGCQSMVQGVKPGVISLGYTGGIFYPLPSSLIRSPSGSMTYQNSLDRHNQLAGPVGQERRRSIWARAQEPTVLADIIYSVPAGHTRPKVLEYSLASGTHGQQLWVAGPRLSGHSLSPPPSPVQFGQ